MAVQVGVAPAGVDLILYAGDDFEMTVKVLDSNNNPVDLTGAIPKAQIRAEAGATDILAEFAIAPVAGDTSALLLALAATKTVSLPSAAFWDLQIIMSAKVMTLAAGKVRTTAEVTR